MRTGLNISETLLVVLLTGLLRLDAVEITSAEESPRVLVLQGANMLLLTVDGC